MDYNYILKYPTQVLIQGDILERVKNILDSIQMEIEEETSAKEPEWLSLLTDREKDEVKLAQLYAKEFNHGTDGHNRLILIAKLVDIINQDLIPAIE